MTGLERTRKSRKKPRREPARGTRNGRLFGDERVVREQESLLTRRAAERTRAIAFVRRRFVDGSQRCSRSHTPKHEGCDPDEQAKGKCGLPRHRET